MRKIDTSACSPVYGFPVKQGTWDFLQAAYTEPIAAILQAQIGASYSASTPYILYGCVASVVGPNTTFTAGAIFFNGEVFLSPAQSIGTPSGSNVIVANILKAQYGTNADPVQFMGLGAPSLNVHNIRTCQFAAGLTGTGTIGDFSTFIGLGAWISGGPISFASNGGSITVDSGDIQLNKYRIDNNTMCCQVSLRRFTLTGTPSAIFVIYDTILSAIGLNFKSDQHLQIAGTYNITNIISGTIGMAGNVLTLAKVDNTNFTAGTNNQSLDFSIITEVG